jgi:hypothetical protein
MSLFQFYSYIDGYLHVSGLQAHPQENSHSSSHNHWFSGCTVRSACSVCTYNIQSTRPEQYSHWTNGCVNSYVNSPEDGPVGPKHVDIRRYMNKIEIVTSVGFSFYMLKECTVQKLKISITHLILKSTLWQLPDTRILRKVKVENPRYPYYRVFAVRT